MISSRKGNVYIVAEMSANHAGNFDRACEIVRAAKRSGADAVKLQTYTPDSLTIDCNNRYFRINDGLWKGKTLYELYESAYTPWDWHPHLFDLAHSLDIDIFSTPFDFDAVDFLDDLGVDIYKVASFENNDLPLLCYIMEKGKPVIASSGLSDIDGIDDLVNLARNYNIELALLKCTSSYPAPFSSANLHHITKLEDRYGIQVGLSDHTFGHIVPTLAVAYGATIIEKHIQLNDMIETPDSAFSLTEDEFTLMVNNVRVAEQVVSGKNSFSVDAAEKQNLIFKRSLFFVEDVERGERITAHNVRSIRPGYGVSPMNYYDIINGDYIATRDIQRGTPVSYDLIVGSDEL